MKQAPKEKRQQKEEKEEEEAGYNMMGGSFLLFFFFPFPPPPPPPQSIVTAAASSSSSFLSLFELDLKAFLQRWFTKTTTTGRRKGSSNFSQLFKALAIRHLSRNAHATSPAENASERTSGKAKKRTEKMRKEHAACTLHGYRGTVHVDQWDGWAFVLGSRCRNENMKERRFF